MKYCFTIVCLPDSHTFYFQIGGGAIFAAGVFLKTGSGFMEPDTLALFNRIKVDAVSVGTMSDGATYVMMIAGVLIMFIALLGLCGAYFGNNSCLCCVSNISWP